MKVLVSLAPQALWQAKQAQFALGRLTLAEFEAASATAPLTDAAAPEDATLLSDSLSIVQLTALLNQYPSAEFIVAYAAPEQQLGLLLAQGDTPQQAAEQWCSQIQALLQLQQQQRKRLKLFNLSFSADNAKHLPAWVAHQHENHVANADDTLYSLLAAQLLRQFDSCAALVPRLEASSLPVNSNYCFDVTALQQLAGDTAALDQVNAQLKASNDERDLLLQKLMQVQEALEQQVLEDKTLKQQYAQQQQQLSQEITSLTAKVQQGEQTVEKTASQLQGLQDELQRTAGAHNQLQQQYTEASAQLTASNDERDLLLQQLLQVQEELEQLFQKKQTVKQQYSQLEQDYRKDVANLSAKLQHGEQTVEKTASQLHGLQDELQRITAAHNQLQQQYTQATAQLTASNDERDLLLQQLLHVQEELEQLFQKKQTVKQQYSQLEQDYRKDVASLSAKLQHGEQTVEKTASQLHKLQDELNRITGAHNQSQQQIKQLSAQQQKLQQQLQSANAQLSAGNDERDLLLQQLLHVQEELEQLFQKKQTVKQQYSQLEQDYRNDVATFTEKLQHGEQTVEKTASQLHKLQDELNRIAAAHNQSQQQLSAGNDERDLLLQQLLHVQEELEQYYFKCQQTEVRLQQAEQKASHSDTARDKQQQRELSKLESQLRKTKARAAGAEHQLQLLQQELGAVKSSTLWKSAAPVRVLKRLVKKTDTSKQKLQQEAALIITSEYFDIDWYLARYPDVASGNINPAEHYLKFGASEGRMPGPLFDGEWYLQRYPDVAASGINPLLHFIKFGQIEGRTASPTLLEDHSDLKQG